MRTDYEESGIPYDAPKIRVDRFEEGIKVIKGCFAGEPFSFSGTHYTITNYTGHPRPVQQPHPPILIGAGAKRMLTLAGREADIVGINFDLRGGQIDPSVGANGTAEATTQKLAWVREGAGARFDDIELHVSVFMAMITDEKETTAGLLAGGFGLTIEEALQVPHALVGTVDDIVETLRERRERFGFSYITFSADNFQALAPVVSALAGT